MKILLIQPPPRHIEHESIVVPPLGLAYLAATLERKGYDVKILDAFALRQSWGDFEEAVKAAGADIIGIGGMTPVIDNTYRALKICRKYCKHLILGGPHVTIFKDSILKEAPEADFAVYGEGEESFAELVDSLNSKKEVGGIAGTVDRHTVNPPRPLIQDLDGLPFPSRHLLPNNRYNYIFAKRKTITTMFTSRGCPYGCIFCDKSVFGSKCRLRSTENVLAEIGQILGRFKDLSIIFYDDLFTLDKERLIRICSGILERGFKFDWKCEGRVDRIDSEMLGWMKKAGCSMIAYGVESGNQAGLDYLKKNTKVEDIRKAFHLTHKSGIRTMAYFILGIPVETYEDELKTIEFSKEIDPDYAQFSVLSPFPGTELYENAIKDGSYREIDVKNPADKDLKKPAVLSRNWDEERLNDIMLKAHKSFYFRPKYLIKRLASIRSMSDFKRFFMAGLKLLSWKAKEDRDMPVNYAQSGKSAEVIYQRDQYKKGGIAKRYWDYRDKVILENIGKDAKVILDAGCGEGITLEKICRIFGDRRVIGFDIIDDNIAICKKHGLPVSKGDIYRLEMPDNSVDCCVLSEVIEHLNDPESALLEIKRVLNPGGRLIVIFPNDLTFKLARIVTLKFKEAFYDSGHCRQWTPGDMKKYLTNIGFKLEFSKSIPFLFWLISLHCVIVGSKQS